MGYKDSLNNFTLLYAEDDKAIQKEMLEYFSSYFKEVFTADDGNEALALYKQHKPDVLILDIYMPHLTGIELTKILRENDYKTKIVLITAHSNDSLLLESINIDVNYYLIKPATLKKVKDMLNKISIDLLRSSEKIIRFDEYIYFNLSSKKLFNKDIEIKLSKKELSLLELFIMNRNKDITIENIMSHCWSDIFIETSLDSVKSLVSNLRKKLPKNTLVNVYGVGYILKNS
ncbi:response regulator transcription factor [Arcobacter porcinus]|uniref:response regulator transcription factor n=1 Tax=Arcobacter porcinus TaxID=1935204 RepID=UPI00081EBA3A|nr:response regulator transcription factor [Arcobacter porcinus]OCL82465.1 Response regulator MprA [Arcobacter porcinus]OCL82545.1 Response regulator MprA [Arcobacter porcinus]